MRPTGHKRRRVTGRSVTVSVRPTGGGRGPACDEVAGRPQCVRGQAEQGRVHRRCCRRQRLPLLRSIEPIGGVWPRRSGVNVERQDERFANLSIGGASLLGDGASDVARLADFRPSVSPYCHIAWQSGAKSRLCPAGAALYGAKTTTMLSKRILTEHQQPLRRRLRQGLRTPGMDAQSTTTRSPTPASAEVRGASPSSRPGPSNPPSIRTHCSRVCPPPART